MSKHTRCLLAATLAGCAPLPTGAQEKAGPPPIVATSGGVTVELKLDFDQFDAALTYLRGEANDKLEDLGNYDGTFLAASALNHPIKLVLMTYELASQGKVPRLSRFRLVEAHRKLEEIARYRDGYRTAVAEALPDIVRRVGELVPAEPPTHFDLPIKIVLCGGAESFVIRLPRTKRKIITEDLATQWLMYGDRGIDAALQGSVRLLTGELFHAIYNDWMLASGFYDRYNNRNESVIAFALRLQGLAGYLALPPEYRLHDGKRSETATAFEREQFARFGAKAREALFSNPKREEWGKIDEIEQLWDDIISPNPAANWSYFAAGFMAERIAARYGAQKLRELAELWPSAFVGTYFQLCEEDPGAPRIDADVADFLTRKLNLTHAVKP